MIDDLKNRVGDKILEESNFILLKKLINSSEDKTEAIAIAELGTTYKRTGFHFDKKLERVGTNIKYLRCNDVLSFNSVNVFDLTHKLIIGDNYDALLNLTISYKSKIDIIYIDPPYGKDDMGEFAQTNYNNAITRDNLLSMLYPRLILAKQLLSDDGVIFCSIDDKNQAYVKCLFDEIFGEENFIQNYVWECNFKPDNSSQLIRPNAENILCYLRNRTQYSKFKKYGAKTTGLASLTKDTEKIKTITFPKNCVKTTLSNGKYLKGRYFDDGWTLEQDIEVKDGIIVTDVVVTGKSYWATSEKIQTEISNGTEIWIKSKKFIPYYHKRDSGQVLPTTILPKDIIYDYQSSKNELKNIFKQSLLFKNPKPTSLIKFLVAMFDSQNAIVLDFFAGSGTTGQAVLELNKEDGGTRTFILCTNNEISENNPNGIAYDVTSKRLKRVMTGKCYDGTCDFEWIKNNDALGGNLQVTEIAEVSNSEQREGLSAFDVIDEKLYGQDFTLSVEDKIRWVCENFSVTQKHLVESKSEV
ncbi:MAG: site-specific DNA-methyltransferase [Succinimonas sp.]|nr:site-specific DNA-methyltransferase [Succinimonas sp.]